MNKLEEALLGLIRAAEAEGKGKTLAELEELVIGYGAQIQSVLMQGLVQESEAGEGKEGEGVSKKTVQDVQRA